MTPERRRRLLAASHLGRVLLRREGIVNFDWVTLEGGQHVWISDDGEFMPGGPDSEPVPTKESPGKDKADAIYDKIQPMYDKARNLSSSHPDKISTHKTFEKMVADAGLSKDQKANLVNRIKDSVKPATPKEPAKKTEAKTPDATKRSSDLSEPKPTWQMSLKEYTASLKGQKLSKSDFYNRQGQISNDHFSAVAQALQTGQHVPNDVIKEYRTQLLHAGFREHPKVKELSAERSGTAWHGNDEGKLAAMRKIQDHVDSANKQARDLAPRGGTLSVGSADFDHTLKATVGEEYLRTLRKGGTPDEAYKAAKTAGTDAVKKWNDTGSKGRVSINNRSELKRWEGSGEAAADHIHNLFKANLPTEKPAAKVADKPTTKIPPGKTPSYAEVHAARIKHFES